ncbi:MAG: acyl-CoA reductase [Chitinophagaceae bacterium]
MKLQERIDLLCRLGDYMADEAEEWQTAKEKASLDNPWFTNEFISIAIKNIREQYLTASALSAWAGHYHLDDNIVSKTVGIVMAGNIPLVGFHDLLSVFISGHKQIIKLSGKDDALLRHLVNKLSQWDARVKENILIVERLTGVDAYIATGSNNTARYFEYYFGRYPSIIRRNRTSVAILEGNETPEQLDSLADDIHIFFGLGCRNVTKLYVPEEYDFVPLLDACKKYGYLADHPKYRNNFDYYLALQIMNHRFYMTNQSLLLVEDEEFFTPVSQLNYSYHTNHDTLVAELNTNEQVQAIVGKSGIPFGKVQQPGITDYADGVDTLQFLLTL